MSSVPDFGNGPQLRLNLTAIVQTLVVAALLGVFAWFGDRVETLSENLTRTLEKQETLFSRLDRVEHIREADEARLRAVELQLAATRKGRE
jgi:hypothetical protein